jgi:S1-C subfamily serine protease
MFKRLMGLMALAAFAPGAADAAEKWVGIVRAENGAAIYVDISSTTIDGDIAHGWARLEEKRAEKAPNGKRYSTMLALQAVDCSKTLVRPEQTIFLDSNGGTVDEGKGRDTWSSIDKETVIFDVATTICAMAKSVKTDDIRQGQWKSLGRERDGSYELSVRMDKIFEVNDANTVVVYSREDWSEFHVDQAVPYRHVVTSYLIDCRRRLVAVARVDYLTEWDRVAATDKFEAKDIKFLSPPPNTVLYRNFDDLCSAPRSTAQETDSQQTAGGISTGTAWATNKGYLVTASHVIDGGKKIEVYQNSKKVGEATVVGNDPANDVAVLKYVPAGGGKIRIIPLADKAGALGKSVFTLGFPAPDIMGQAIKMSAGDISATSGLQDDARFLQVSIPIQEGNSGGPVIGFDGAAVGVVSAKLARLSDDRNALKPENVNYAVKIAYLRPLLEELPDLADYTSIKVAGATPEDLIAQAREAVFMLVVRP